MLRSFLFSFHRRTFHRPGDDSGVVASIAGPGNGSGCHPGRSCWYEETIIGSDRMLFLMARQGWGDRLGTAGCGASAWLFVLKSPQIKLNS